MLDCITALPLAAIAACSGRAPRAQEVKQKTSVKLEVKNKTSSITPRPGCPDPWAEKHYFINHNTGQVIPARCKRWSCYSCALTNYLKVDYLAAAGNPERFITLTRAGNTPEEIRINLQKLIQGIRRKGLLFEYFAVIELHRNGLPHIHLFQRGDFIEQAELSAMWGIYTAKSFLGRSSTIVDIRRIREKQNVKGYLLKYLKKTWAQDNHDDKSWSALQAKFPGLNHYRHSRAWLPAAAQQEQEWHLVAKESYEAGTFILEKSIDPYPAWSKLQKLLVSQAGYQSSEVKGVRAGTPAWSQTTLDERPGARNRLGRGVGDNTPYQAEFGFDLLAYAEIVLRKWGKDGLL